MAADSLTLRSNPLDRTFLDSPALTSLISPKEALQQLGHQKKQFREHCDRCFYPLYSTITKRRHANRSGWSLWKLVKICNQSIATYQAETFQHRGRQVLESETSYLGPYRLDSRAFEKSCATQSPHPSILSPAQKWPSMAGHLIQLIQLPKFWRLLLLNIILWYPHTQSYCVIHFVKLSSVPHHVA